jgi:hypothetical protein
MSAVCAPRGECRQPEKVLVREPTTVIAIPTPQTSSLAVKCSLGLHGRWRHKAWQRFRWSEPCVVGATGFEPVTPFRVRSNEPLPTCTSEG